ncbi:MAG: glycine cleavage system protein GcvH [Sinobacteraceae bacterium]|nr:glycine cleavage system protein GcvH [Nevskiaceae bacterium]
MSKIPGELKYAKTHEWVKSLPGGEALVGITDHAQQALGDLVFIELPKPGRRVAAGEACAVVESVKAASDVYAPIAGEILEVNAALADAPELLNQDPYGQGWLWKMKPAHAEELAKLLDAAAYEKIVAES